MNPDGTINENGGPFAGMGREEARSAVAARLDEEGLLGEVRDYPHRVGHCDRCGAVIEPWLSEQWWCSMRELAEPAIEALKNNEITVYPDSWRRETIRWLENIHDWNVSRQLWWGHRIPVWYGPDGEVVATKESPGEGFEQDADILDTWFSSGLWPFATLGWPEENEDLAYFYPTSLLSTAREIMYLWVARMIMMGLRFRGEVPFGKVNVHSIVLAEDGTKMSKSKGNTINPLDLFDQYGTDAVRFGLLYQSSTQDFAYSYERAEMGRAFVTKLWNATRFVLAYPEGDESGRPLAFGPLDPLGVQPHRQGLRRVPRGVRVLRGDAPDLLFRLEPVRRLVHRDSEGHPLARHTPRPARGLPRHPEAPPPCDALRDGGDGTHVWGRKGCSRPAASREYDPALEDEEADRLLDRTKRAVSAVRSFRAESKVEGELEGLLPEGIDEGVFVTLAGVKPVETSDGANRASLPAGDVVVEILLSDEMRRGEIERLRREISRAEQEVKRSEGKLANEKFVQNAPEKVVAGEREKLDVNARMLETLSRRLDEYL